MEALAINIIAQAVIFLYPAWRIYSKAGLNPPISLIVLVPGIGPLFAILILVFFKWPVQSLKE